VKPDGPAVRGLTIMGRCRSRPCPVRFHASCLGAVSELLTPQLLELGGHIGQVVRIGARRRGHATVMLAAALPVCRQLGIDRVLVTCNATNTASRKVIEANGGEFEVRCGVKLRYWIRTGN